MVGQVQEVFDLGLIVLRAFPRACALGTEGDDGRDKRLRCKREGLLNSAM